MLLLNENELVNQLGITQKIKWDNYPMYNHEGYDTDWKGGCGSHIVYIIYRKRSGGLF